MNAHKLTRLLATGISLTLLAAAAGCGSGQQVAADSGQPYVRAARVETLRVTPRTFNENVDVTGVVEATNDAMLAAQASGKVAEIAEIGDGVAAGAVLARLDQAAARAAVAQAEAQVQTAQAQRSLALDRHDRLLPLKDRRAISASEFEQARLELERAEAGLRQAEAALVNANVQLDNTEVKAPFAGTVEQVLLEVGEHAGPGDPLLRLVSIGEVKVIAAAAERYAPDLRVGMPVQVSFPSVDIAPRAGEITFVGSAIEAASRTFRIEVQVANPERDLKPMMLAEVLVTRRQYADVLTVPRIAVVNDELGPGVYVVDRGESGAVARRREVTLGVNAVGFVVIASGLEPGDEVIVLGQHTISDGDPVEVGGNQGAAATGLPDATSGR